MRKSIAKYSHFALMLLTVVALLFAAHGYDDSHRDYAGRKVIILCGQVVPADRFPPGGLFNPPEVCPDNNKGVYTQENNVTELRISMAVLAAILLIDLVAWKQSQKSKD